MKKTILFLLPLLLILTACGGNKLNSEASQRLCSVSQGFDFYTPGQGRIGYLTYLKIGDVECPADFTVTDPSHISNKINVVGVFAWFVWTENKKDPLVFAAQVSGANKDLLSALGKTDVSKLGIRLAFTLYDFDSKAGVYYPSLSSDSKQLQGMLDFENGHLLYYMSEDTSAYVDNPANYAFQLGVLPTKAGQQILSASAADKSSLKTWSQ